MESVINVDVRGLSLFVRASVPASSSLSQPTTSPAAPPGDLRRMGAFGGRVSKEGACLWGCCHLGSQPILSFCVSSADGQCPERETAPPVRLKLFAICKSTGGIREGCRHNGLLVAFVCPAFSVPCPDCVQEVRLGNPNDLLACGFADGR